MFRFSSNHRQVGFRLVLGLVFLLLAAPVSGQVNQIGMLYGVVGVPVAPVSGEEAVLRLAADGCLAWRPGWAASVTTPEPDLILVNVTVDIEPRFCFGFQWITVDVPFFAPAAGIYRIRVVGSGLYHHGSPALPPTSYSFRPYLSPTPLTILGGAPAAVVVPVSVMSPWAIAGLLVLLALVGHLVARARERISG